MHFLCSATSVVAEAVCSTTAVQATIERRLSDGRLPGEPGPSTDDGRPWPADATTSATRVPLQRHHRHYRSDSCRPQSLSTEPQQQRQTYTTTPAPAMITVAASGSRALRPKPQVRGPSSSIPFPVDVADRLRSPTASTARPRQYGRRRSVQEAVASAVMVQRQERLQLQAADATVVEPSTEQQQAFGADQEPGQEPRLVSSLRLVHAIAVSMLLYYMTIVAVYTRFPTYSAFSREYSNLVSFSSRRKSPQLNWSTEAFVLSQSRHSADHIINKLQLIGVSGVLGNLKG